MISYIRSIKFENKKYMMETLDIPYHFFYALQTFLTPISDPSAHCSSVAMFLDFEEIMSCYPEKVYNYCVFYRGLRRK